jgi:hypothetical protein
MKSTKKLKRARAFSIFWSLFIGIGALWGGVMMLVEPSGKIWGMAEMLPYFQKLPYPDVFFQNFIFPGIALLIVNGITNFISFFLIYKNHRLAALSAMLCGIILMLWIVVQFIIFPLNFMSTLYFIFGVLQAWTGYKYLNHKRKRGMEMFLIENT